MKLSKSTRIWSVVILLALSITGIYIYWLKNAAPKYGAVLSSHKISEDGLSEIIINEQGVYGVNLVMNRNACEIKNDDVICSLLIKKRNKCLINIKGAHKTDASDCGDFKGHTSESIKIKLADIYINQKDSDISINIGSVSSADSLSSIIEITREPETKFVRFIHPGYYRNQILASIYLLLYPGRYLILSIAMLFVAYKIWRVRNV